jgi:SAM-dependent methyltransferase
MAHPTIEPHNEKPAATWNSAGDAYDEISRGIADSIEHAIFRLSPRPGERILDLATGTGWTSRQLALRGARVTGVDLGADLVEAARARARAARLEIEDVVGDAERLQLEDASFDAVISTYGVMFASRPEAAAAEVARVCKRGGRLALTTWTPDGNVFGMFKVMKPYMPPPPTPAPPSPFEWGRRERLRELFGKSFELAFEDGTSFYREPRAEVAWTRFVTGYGPTKMLANGLSPDRRAGLERDFIAFHARPEFATELGICVPREYLLTIGVRT